MKTSKKAYVMHALWFKPEGGEDKYFEYYRAIAPLLKEVGARKLKSMAPEREIIGSFDADLIYFVEFPSWDAFKEFANSSENHRVAHLREEALADSIMISCSRPCRSLSGETQIEGTTEEQDSEEAA